MHCEPLVFVGSCDLAGIVRGKGFPEAELAARLKQGVGLTHSNIMMSAFGPIYDTPFGTLGDLMLVADRGTRVEVAFEGGAAGLTPDSFLPESGTRQYEVTIAPTCGIRPAKICARYAEVY